MVMYPTMGDTNPMLEAIWRHHMPPQKSPQQHLKSLVQRLTRPKAEACDCIALAGSVAREAEELPSQLAAAVQEAASLSSTPGPGSCGKSVCWGRMSTTSIR